MLRSQRFTRAVTSRATAPAALGVLAAAALLLTACSGGPASVSGTTWGTPDATGETSITFKADGSVSGSDGCNVVGGDWKESDDTIELTLLSTMMYCEGVDMWLTESRTAELRGDRLVFLGEDGSEVGSLLQPNGY